MLQQVGPLLHLYGHGYGGVCEHMCTYRPKGEKEQKDSGFGKLSTYMVVSFVTEIGHKLFIPWFPNMTIEIPSSTLLTSHSSCAVTKVTAPHQLEARYKGRDVFSRTYVHMGL